MRFFSPSNCAFYDDAIHGPRKIEEALTSAQIKARRKPRLVDNPDCKLPDDARPISDADYQAMMDAQAAGQQIVARAGKAIAVDRVRSPEEALAANTARRDRLLRETDWTQLPDTLLDAPAYKAALAEWRQQLRDMDLAIGDFPETPEA